MRNWMVPEAGSRLSPRASNEYLGGIVRFTVPLESLVISLHPLWVIIRSMKVPLVFFSVNQMLMDC